MHRNVGPVFFLLALCVFSWGAAGQTPPVPGAAPSGTGPVAQLPPGEGREVTIRVCGKCHDAGTFANQDLDAEGWKQTVDEMASSGAEGSDADFAAVTAYLTKAFPPQ